MIGTDTVTSPDERRLIERLKSGDEAAFGELIDRYHGQMLRLAMVYVSTRAVADEVVQEAWLGVQQGIGRFEGRSSLKTWIFRIVANIARTRGVREARTVPFTSLAGADEDGAAVDPERFVTGGESAGHWASPIRSWGVSAEQITLSGEAMGRIAAEIDRLPEVQRIVVTMRDIDGFDSDEVCETLGISQGNQRVLLHRGRTRVREALADYFDDGASG